MVYFVPPHLVSPVLKPRIQHLIHLFPKPPAQRPRPSRRVVVAYQVEYSAAGDDPLDSPRLFVPGQTGSTVC